jgi:Holliday junction resolvasome RuvABC ATP-dependent DNA helicase subunit
MNVQQEMLFFPKDSDPPPSAVRRAFLDPKNPESPYFGFFGNERAISKLNRVDFTVLERYNHCCNDLSFALLGPSGCGKTDIARRHAKVNGLPFVEISPKSVKATHDVLTLVARGLANTTVPLVESGDYDNYILPPMNIFIDEVHALPQPIVQGLLKATEPKDAILVTERGWVADCSRVHWIIATTDRGKLFDAFDTRFSKVSLNMYTKADIAKIIQFTYPDWPNDICDLVAHFCGRIPREALFFAKEMRLEYNMNPASWKEVALKVAADNEIDELGMSYKRLAILKALGEGPVAEKRLPIIASVKQEELDKFILPWLLASTEDQQQLITVSNRGYTITEAGIEELKKRKLPYSAEAA